MNAVLESVPTVPTVRPRPQLLTPRRLMEMSVPTVPTVRKTVSRVKNVRNVRPANSPACPPKELYDAYTPPKIKSIYGIRIKNPTEMTAKEHEYHLWIEAYWVKHGDHMQPRPSKLELYGFKY